MRSFLFNVNRRVVTILQIKEETYCRGGTYVGVDSVRGMQKFAETRALAPGRMPASGFLRKEALMPRPDIIVYPNTMARTTAMYGISIREDVLFADEKGVDNAGVRRQNEKVLAKLVPALQRTLLPDEVVLYATRAISQLSV